MSDSAKADSILAKIGSPSVPEGMDFDFRAHLQRQREFSERTFGPGARAQGVVDHIRRELLEVEAAPTDLSEWIDVVILALDGAWRAGYSPDQIITQLVTKQAKNEGRKWPDWRTADPNKAIEHDRAQDAPSSAPEPPEPEGIKPAEIMPPHHKRHPWCQPGDRADRVWMLRFEDNDMRTMLWANDDAEQQARAAYAQYSPTWNCYLFATIPAEDPTEPPVGDG